VRKPPSFSTNRSPKMRELFTHFMFGGWCGAEYWLHSTVYKIFSSNKIVPANRKKGFGTGRLLKNEEIGGIFVFRTFNSLQKFKIKI
jgi:hypothetical protein